MNSLRTLLLDKKSEGYSGDINYAGLEAIDSNGAVLITEQSWSEYNELTMNIEHLCHIHGGLEEIQATVEASLTEDGLDRTGATLLVSGTNALLQPLEHSLPLPSLERFGGRSERIGSTQIALEALKEKIAQIWEAIKRAFESLRVKLSDWFTAIFNSIPKINARAEKIVEEAGKISGSAKKENFEFNISKLSVDGKAVEDLSNNLSSLVVIAKSLTPSNYNHISSGAATAFEGCINKLKVQDSNTISEGMTSFYNFLLSFISSLKGLPLIEEKTPLPASYDKNKAFGSTEEINFYRGIALIGNKAFYFGEPKDVDTGSGIDPKVNMENLKKYFSQVSKMGWKISELDTSLQFKKDKVSIPTPSANEIKEMAEKVIQIMENIDQFKETSKKVLEVKKSLMKKGDDLSKKIKENKVTEAQSSLSSLTVLTKDVANQLGGPCDIVLNYCVITSNAILNYCQAALACYK